MSPLGDLMCSERLGELGKKQLNIELCGTITVKSILKKEDKDTRNHFVRFGSNPEVQVDLWALQSQCLIFHFFNFHHSGVFWKRPKRNGSGLLRKPSYGT